MKKIGLVFVIAFISFFSVAAATAMTLDGGQHEGVAGRASNFFVRVYVQEISRRRLIIYKVYDLFFCSKADWDSLVSDFKPFTLSGGINQEGVPEWSIQTDQSSRFDALVVKHGGKERRPAKAGCGSERP